MKKKFLVVCTLFSLLGFSNIVFAEESTFPEIETSIFDSLSTENNTDSYSSNDSDINPPNTSLDEENMDIIEIIYNEGLFTNVLTGEGIRIADDQTPLVGSSTVNRSQGYIDLGEAYQFAKGWTFKNITFKGNIYQPGDRIYDENFKTIEFPYWTDINRTGICYNYEPSEDFYVNISYGTLTEDFSSELIQSLNLPTNLGPFPGEISLTLSPSEIPGYTAKHAMVYMSPTYGFLPIGETYWFMNGTARNSIRYIYESDDSIQEGSPITIRYVDTEGNQLTTDVTLKGKNNEPYSTQAAEFDGYRLIEIIGEETGIFGLESKNVTYKYEKVINAAYIDYKENTIVSISDLARDLEIIKNYNVNLMTEKNGNIIISQTKNTNDLNLINKVVKTTKRIETANGNVYYMISDSGKDYVILSKAFRTATTEYDFSIAENMNLYSNISLDYTGNYLSSTNDVSQKITLVNNFNVYDLLNTGGDNALSPIAGTSSSLNLLNKNFDVTKEYTTSGGSKFYNIVIDGYNYFINAAAFVVETIQSLFE